jgi:hypothetical protein
VSHLVAWQLETILDDLLFSKVTLKTNYKVHMFIHHAVVLLAAATIATTRKKKVGLEQGPLSLVSTTEELLDRKVTAPV